MVSPDKLYEKLIERITKAQPKGNIEEVRHAYEFALKWHQGQKRVSGEDYICHPLEAVSYTHLDVYKRQLLTPTPLI